MYEIKITNTERILNIQKYSGLAVLADSAEQKLKLLKTVKKGWATTRWLVLQLLAQLLLKRL